MYILMRTKCEIENDYNPKWLDLKLYANLGMNDVWIIEDNCFTT